MSTISSIPIFPSFASLNVSQATDYSNFISNYPTYSDFGFTSLLSWDTNESVQLSLLNGNLVVRFEDYVDKTRFYTLLGTYDIDSSIKELIKLSTKNGYGNTLKLIPQTVVDAIIDKQAFNITDDRDNFDYILSVKMHSELTGKKSEDRRYRINHFMRNYGDELEIKVLKLDNETTKAAIIDFVDKWAQLRNIDKEHYEIERLAISRLLNFSNLLPLHCLGFYIDKELAAFCVYEGIHANSGVVHFEKCNLRFSGIAHYVRHETAKRFEQLERQFINYEQDLGIEGLRKSKEMLHPESYLKKYTVSLA